MKHSIRTAMTKICSLCLVLSGLMYWDVISIFLFGEKEYPDKSDF